MEICTDGGTIRQLVYRYPPRLSGTNDFAVWHVGSDHLTVYMPEGTVIRAIQLAAPGRQHAGCAAASHGEVVSVHESTSIYPRGN